MSSRHGPIIDRNPSRVICPLRGTTTAALAVALSVIVSTGVQAAERNGCELSLSPPTLDYGKSSHPTAVLEPVGTRGIELGRRITQLTIVCPRASIIQLSYEGAADALARYRFGEGLMEIHLSNAQIDGQSGQFLATDGVAAPDFQLKPSERVTLVGGESAGGSQYSVQVSVDAFLPLAGSRITEPTTLSENGAFRIH